jgi:hypothetical protein
MAVQEGNIMKWLTIWWYKYLLEPKQHDTSWFTAIRCRMNGHKCGVVYYNPTGVEPDMHCKVCGDDLG